MRKIVSVHLGNVSDIVLGIPTSFQCHLPTSSWRARSCEGSAIPTFVPALTVALEGGPMLLSEEIYWKRREKKQRRGAKKGTETSPWRKE